ncbi:MAG: hypothetical protein ACP5E5_08835 [Acidobacteriaceae bacterium]
MTFFLRMRTDPSSRIRKTASSFLRLRVALMLCLMVGGGAFLDGCGSSPSPPLTPPSPSQSIPGNWEFTANITSSGWGQGEAVPMGVYLTRTASAVTGIAWVQMAFSQICTAVCCGGPFYEFNEVLSGTLSNADVLSLTSVVPDDGPLFSMSGAISGESLTAGTFNLTGGCPASGSITGVEIPPLNGVYSGTLTSKTTGQSYKFSTTLEQSSALDARGLFSVSGTGTLAAYPCLTSVSVPAPITSYSGMLGSHFGLTMTGADGGQFELNGTLASDGETITVSYDVAGGSCANDIGSGTLMLQPQ